MSYNTELQNNNKELREILEDVNNLPEAGSGDVALPDYWESYLPDKVAAIKAHQDEGGKDCFSFIVMTDIHYPSNLGKRSPAIAKRIIDECNIRYVMCLGDVQNRGSHSSKANVVAEWESIKTMFEPIRENLLAEQGNHDGSWGATLNGVTYPYNFKPEELFNYIFANTYKYHNAITDESGTAYYVDDTTRKVRYILLNTQCNPYEENEDGSAKYNNMKYFRFTQSQYDFLTNKALVLDEDGWAVVVLAHAPIENNYASAWGGDTTTGDHVIMRNLLKAYKEKKTYSAEWAGTAGGGAPTGGYTNLFSTSGSGFTKQSDTKYLTNWIPYNVADNGGKGTIYHLKGFANNANYTNPYKMHFATDANGTGASELMYCTNASVLKNEVASYDSNVKLVQHTTGTAYKYVQFEFREALPENLIITANEDIIEATGGGELGYDAVSVNADFTNAKGEFIAYFSGHMHGDYVYAAKDYFGIDIITTRCDAASENNSTLLAERVEGTTTEQSFDVFTVNKKTRKIYATKIGAGADREISY